MPRHTAQRVAMLLARTRIEITPATAPRLDDGKVRNPPKSMSFMASQTDSSGPIVIGSRG